MYNVSQSLHGNRCLQLQIVTWTPCECVQPQNKKSHGVPGVENIPRPRSSILPHEDSFHYSIMPNQNILQTCTFYQFPSNNVLLNP